MIRRALLCVALAAGLLLSTRSRAQIIEVPTFDLGGPTSGLLQDVDVAAGDDGSFAVIWGEYTSNLSGRNDHAVTRRFSAQGVPLGPPQRVDTSAHVFNPSISADGKGGYVAAWEWINGNAHLYRFFGQILDSDARAIGADFEVSIDHDLFLVGLGQAIGLASGPHFLWNENGLWLRGVDAANDRAGGDIRAGNGGYIAIDTAQTADGGFVAVWNGSAGESPYVARFFSPAGQPRGDALPIVDGLASPRVAARPGGGFAVTAYNWTSAPDTSQIWIERHAADGSIVGERIPVDSLDGHWGLDTAPQFDALGNLYVSWTIYPSGGGTPLPPRARVFDVDGNPTGPPLEISAQPGVEMHSARLTNGSIANVWYWQSRAFATVIRTCSAATCGDGNYEPACEQCDDGTANSDSAPNACRTDCTRAGCGDGVIDAGEQCDDGNTQSCDGCSSTCQVEAGYRCGDGIRERACGERCDDGAANSDSTPDACRSDCKLARCGDGVVDSDEECDDGNTVSCDGCSFDCKLESAMADADGNGVADVCDVCRGFRDPKKPLDAVCDVRTLEGMSAAQQQRFAGGVEEFVEVERPATGLGPIFNGAACAECHSFPRMGGSSDHMVTRIGFLAPDGYTFDPLTAHGGPLLQSQGLTTPTCSVGGEVVPPEANVTSQRNTPALFGAGLLEAIPELKIRLFADPTDRNHDGISGRYNIINGRVGRFGWKAQFATLHDFAADAYLGEMGITTPFAPQESGPQGGAVTCDDEQDPEDDGTAIDAFSDFMLYLAPPPGGERSRDARQGRGVFRRMRCHKCHTDRYRTANFPVKLLNRRRVRAYTDLLLHDMGPDLADGIRQGSASGSEFRTPPLWGVRYSAPYLHDGRAMTLDEAIRMHGGEATDSRNRYQYGSQKDRDRLIAFLNSL